MVESFTGKQATFGNVRLTPTSFLIAADGRIVYRKTGELSMTQLRQDILDILKTTQASQRHPATAENI
jgi:peroxiredoxin